MTQHDHRSRSRSTSTTARTGRSSRACLAAGWNSVLFDASKLTRRGEQAPVHRGRRRGAPLRRARSRARSRAFKRRRRTRSAPTTAGTSRRWRRVVDFIEATGVDVFAPAIGNAARHRTRRRPMLDTQRVTDIVAATGIPIALHGGTGMSAEQFTRPHRPRLRQGQHLDRAQDRVHAVGLRLHDRATRASTTRRRSSAHQRAAVMAMATDHIRHVRQRRQGLVAMPTLIFDCDGVLADTERYGHLPAFNQTFARVRPAGPVVRGGVRPEARDRRRQGADGQRAHARVRPRGTACPRTPRARPPRSPNGTSARPRSTPRWSRPAGCPPGRASAGSSRTRQDAGLDARGRLDVGRAVGAGDPRARGRRTERAARFDLVLAGDVVPREEARPRHLPARARAPGRRAAPRCSSSRTRATACSPPSARACAASMTVNGYTEEEDNSEAILVVVSRSATRGRADARDREPRRRAARRLHHAARISRPCLAS